MQQFFKCLNEANLTINLTKSDFSCGTVTYFGHIIESMHAKIKAISVFPPPTKKHVMCFLSMASYYWKFFPNFSFITQPLIALLRKDVKFVCTEFCQSCLQATGSNIAKFPCLRSSRFQLTIQASCECK